MLHVVKQIQRHFPNQSSRVVTGLLVLSASALAVGVGLMLLNR
jgi:hypothetical protein